MDVGRTANINACFCTCGRLFLLVFLVVGIFERDCHYFCPSPAYAVLPNDHLRSDLLPPPLLLLLLPPHLTDPFCNYEARAYTHLSTLPAEQFSLVPVHDFEGESEKLIGYRQDIASLRTFRTCTVSIPEYIWGGRRFTL